MINYTIMQLFNYVIVQSYTVVRLCNYAFMLLFMLLYNFAIMQVIQLCNYASNQIMQSCDGTIM